MTAVTLDQTAAPVDTDPRAYINAVLLRHLAASTRSVSMRCRAHGRALGYAAPAMSTERAERVAGLLLQA